MQGIFVSVCVCVCLCVKLCTYASDIRMLEKDGTVDLQFMCCRVAGGCNIGITMMSFECVLKRIFFKIFLKNK